MHGEPGLGMVWHCSESEGCSFFPTGHDPGTSVSTALQNHIAEVLGAIDDLVGGYLLIRAMN